MAANVTETFEEFDSRLINIVSGGFMTMAIGLGVDTGLFDVMCSMDGPKTSQEIADLAGLKERYVREWLGAMAMGRIVDFNGDQETYHIPEHRIPALKPKSGKNAMTLYAKGVPMLSSVYKDIAECFKKDGPNGMAYSKYSDFHGFMAGLSSRWFDNYLIQHFVPGIPTLKEKLDSGIQVLDVGCGEGGASHLFAQNYPNSQIYGLDFQQHCITKATEIAANKGLENIHFVCQEASGMDPIWDSKFDYVFMHEILHDSAYPDKLLDETYRVMKSDGILSVIDTGAHSKLEDNLNLSPTIGISYVCSMMNCVPVSLNFEGGMGLGAVWGKERAVEMLSDHGFDCEVSKTPGTKFGHFLCKKAK
ncbi:S-adenosylmethionine-dependent methyltransferase Rv2258c-like isoform X1 [Amphiura filiformis]|uniref:S-adenosylmethionine-dependent methyltransferase Rv2258c-like isoform X1 n=1 Tax=Amphiura filiformis TaxID=82378 RepID=UPI003B21EBEA